MAHGKEDKALETLANVHANGNLNDEVVQLEFVEIRDTLKMENELEGVGWMQLFKGRGNRKRMIILLTAGFFSQWSGNGIASYYLSTVLNQIGYTDTLTQNLINGVLQIFNLFVAVSMCFLVDKIGRRVLFLTSTAGMMVTYICWTIAEARYFANGARAAANAVIAFVYIYYFFYNMAWSGLLVGYTVEILPFNIRAKGMTLMFLCVDVALFFNQYVNPIALANIEWRYQIFYCCWLAVELATVYVSHSSLSL